MSRQQGNILIDPEWLSRKCDTEGMNNRIGDFARLHTGHRTNFPRLQQSRQRSIRIVTEPEPGWAKSAHDLVMDFITAAMERRKQELRVTLLQSTLQSRIGDLEKRLHKLECAQTKIIPIDTFAPDPYALTRTILTSVNAVEGGFNAGWYDVNVHSFGVNEEDAVSSLKCAVLDLFDELSKATPEGLGPEPLRQLAVLRQYLHKSE